MKNKSQRELESAIDKYNKIRHTKIYWMMLRFPLCQWLLIVLSNTFRVIYSNNIKKSKINYPLLNKPEKEEQTKL